jgi:hypothetical protein
MRSSSITTSPLGDTATLGPNRPTATPLKVLRSGGVEACGGPKPAGYAMWMNLATLGVPSAVIAKSR